MPRFSLTLFTALLAIVALEPRPACAADGRPAVLASGDVAKLTSILADESQHFSVRRAAAYQLGLLGPQAAPAVDALVAALDDRQLELVWYAMDTLGRIGPRAKAAVPAMVEAMQNPTNDAVLRAGAARSLARLGPDAEEAIPALADALEHEEAEFRIAAAVALWKIAREPRALLQLKRELASSDPETVYLAALGAADLGKVSDLGLLKPSLEKALGHASRDVRHAAMCAWANQGPAEVRGIIAAAKAQPVSKQKLQAAIAALRWVGETRRQAYSVESSGQDTSPDQMQEAGDLEECAQVVVPFLISLTASGDEEIRGQAADALSAYGILALSDLVQQLSPADTRGLAARIAGLERLLAVLPPTDAQVSPAYLRHRNQAATDLTTAMAHQDVEIRRAAVRAYAALSIGDPTEEAKSRLKTLLADPDLRIRRYAADALR